MSDAMRATKTEPVLQWQTKEELQRGKNGIEKRGGCSVEDDRRGRRRTGDVQVDAGGEKVEADVVEEERDVKATWKNLKGEQPLLKGG